MSSYHKIRDPEQYDKALANEEFMKWLNEYEPDWSTEFWNRNIVTMHHAFLKS